MLLHDGLITPHIIQYVIIDNVMYHTTGSIATNNLNMVPYHCRNERVPVVLEILLLL